MKKIYYKIAIYSILFITILVWQTWTTQWMQKSVEQDINAFIERKWRHLREDILDKALSIVDNHPSIQQSTKELLINVLEEKLGVYTNGEQSLLQHLWLRTDTSIRAIALEDILDWGPWKDGIPSLSFPWFVSQLDAENEWYVRDELEGIVLKSTDGTDSRFYPFSILNWHEIVNDVVWDIPVAITYCPLCGTAIVYDRRIDTTVLEFGVSWLLYQSNLLMYDDATETLWSQAYGEWVVGTYTDYQLKYIQSQQMNYKDFTEAYPNWKVMSNQTWYQRDYRLWSPYLWYESSDALYFPVHWRDRSIDSKRRMIVINDSRWFSAAFDRKDLLISKFASIPISDQITLTAYVDDDGRISIEDWHHELPHFVEMWFSRSARNQWSDLRRNTTMQ